MAAAAQDFGPDGGEGLFGLGLRRLPVAPADGGFLPGPVAAGAAEGRSREKTRTDDGTWQHTRIVLRPDTDREDYEPIVLTEEQEGEVRVVAELLGVVAG